MHGPVAELPQQPAVDGAERQFARLRPAPRIGHVVEDPAQLGTCQVGVEHQTRPALEQLFVARRAQFVAQARGSPVLPHDGVVHRLPGTPIPHHRGLALVGDADGGDVAPRQTGVRDRLGGDADLRRPDLVGVVFDPARLREDLPELLLRDGFDLPCVIEHDRALTGGALVERKHVFHVHLRL